MHKVDRMIDRDKLARNAVRRNKKSEIRAGRFDVRVNNEGEGERWRVRGRRKSLSQKRMIEIRNSNDSDPTSLLMTSPRFKHLLKLSVQLLAMTSSLYLSSEFRAT